MSARAPEQRKPKQEQHPRPVEGGADLSLEKKEGEHTELWKELEGMEGESLHERLAGLRESGEINDLSRSEQEALILRVVSGLEEDIESGEGHPFIDSARVVDYFLPRTGRDPDAPDIIDTFASEMPKIWRAFPLSASQLDHVFSRDANLAKPEAYLQSLAEILHSVDLPEEARSRALAGAAYQARYIAAFLREHPAHLASGSVERAGQQLSMLEEVAENSYRMRWSSRDAKEIERVLEDFSDNAASALIRRKANAVLDHSARVGFNWTTEEIRQFWLHTPSPYFSGEDPYQIPDQELHDLWQSPHVRNILRESEFIWDKQEAGKKYGTKGIVAETGVSTMVVPVNADFLGAYDNRHRLIALLPAEEGKKHYEKQELVRPDEIPLLAISEGLSPEEAERRRQAQRDYAMLLDKGVLDGIEKDYGFPVRELSTREQLWFMAALRDLSVEDEQEVMAFTSAYGIDGARAFLSVEEGDEFRDVVLELGERLDPASAKMVFRRYAEIAKVAQESVDEELQKFFKEGRDESAAAEAVQREMLSRARELLAATLKQMGTKKGAVPSRVAGLLKRHKKETLIFASIFKGAMKDNPELGFEDVQGLEFESTYPKAISKADQERMLEIFDDNWINPLVDRMVALHTNPEKEASIERQIDVAKSIKHQLENKLDPDNRSSKFYLLRKDGEVEAFLRWDNMPGLGSRHVYGGSLNVSPDLRGSGIGSAVLTETINHVARDHVIHAHAQPALDAGTAYVEKFKCVVTGVEKGQALKLRRDDRREKFYKAREEGVKYSDLMKGEVPGVRVEKFDVTTETEAMKASVERAAENGEVATRYWADRKNPSIRYLAFEKDAPDPDAQEA